MKTEAEPWGQSAAQLKLGLCYTAVLAIAYGTFLFLSACAPQVLATPVAAGGEMTWAFAFGFAVIALGVLLTWLYAFIANRRERETQESEASVSRGHAEIGQIR